MNGCDVDDLPSRAGNLKDVMDEFPFAEFIMQRSEETMDLCLSLESLNPSNMSFLFDESKGRGVTAEEYRKAPDTFKVGYAGGINPGNIAAVLSKVLKAGEGKSVYMDMESGIRTNVDGKDSFDLAKCYDCVEEICAAGLFVWRDRK